MFHGTIRARLGRDPETRTTPSNMTICSFSVATDHGWGDKKKTTWVTITCFGKTADWAAKNLGKGDEILVLGDIYNDEWTDKEGNKRVTLKCDANKVEKLTASKPATNGSHHAAADEGGI